MTSTAGSESSSCSHSSPLQLATEVCSAVCQKLRDVTDGLPTRLSCLPSTTPAASLLACYLSLNQALTDAIWTAVRLRQSAHES